MSCSTLRTLKGASQRGCCTLRGIHSVPSSSSSWLVACLLKNCRTLQTLSVCSMQSTPVEECRRGCCCTRRLCVSEAEIKELDKVYRK
ncbi:Hypothetical protein, putative [Bodo saltans]|uniref:Uncharacterized protein n=1 Tax=Bodo saltans TaxID=75058 RepID=A0A0S4J4Z3_BODSA|nr:Hypothetical protein, putative [Bodo saltans]|eukprot:CUG86535.1 Hypothetical protein, putative [Bodo saltans]